ncbi:MAG: class I SAM-dependent methyltransferase [Planctomycetota bacterium]
MTDLTKHDLYELCLQNSAQLAPVLRAIHGNEPTILGEDFAGTAVLSNVWASRDGCHAIAVDLDGDALSHHGDVDGVKKTAANVLDVTEPCDVLFVGNFSIGYWHTRDELVAYLRHARSRLRDGGVFIYDIYGGETAFLIGDVHREHRIANGPHAGKRVRYTWSQREANPLTGMVTNTCSFRVENAGHIENEFEDAFIYNWRLWSVPELHDAMRESGYHSIKVFSQEPDAIDGDGRVFVHPVSAPPETDGDFIVLIAAGE